MPISAESNVKQHVIILQLRYNLSACEAPFRKSEWTLLRSSAKGNLHLHQLRADACALRPHIWVAERRIRVLGQQRISVRTNLHSVGKEFQLRRGKKRIKANVQTKHLRLTFLRATILHDFYDFVNQNAEASKNYSSSPSRIPRWGLFYFRRGEATGNGRRVRCVLLFRMVSQSFGYIHDNFPLVIRHFQKNFQ